jgi:glycosyltransferase involved in cell wall biosynthesis
VSGGKPTAKFTAKITSAARRSVQPLPKVGRWIQAKGFDDLLDALDILCISGPRVPHTVLAAVTDGPPRSAYQRHLAHRIDAGRLDVTLHTTFSPGIRALLGHPALAGVVVPSRAEPFGRIPLEAYAAGASPVIAT